MNSHAYFHHGRPQEGVEVVKRVMYEPSSSRVGTRGRIARSWHGVLDYAFGFLLLAAPWMFGFAGHPEAARLAWILGGATLLYSMMTNYELGLLRLLPFSAHLALDVLLGVALLLAWVNFASAGVPGVVFAAFGAIALLVVLLSRNERSFTVRATGP